MRLRAFNVPAVWVALATAVLIVTCRIWLAGEVPLTDTTESRYAEMARKMVETGDWLMPQHDYGVPYLAKPPLAIWLSAAGIKVLGPHELGPRLLILLTAIGFLIYFHRWVSREVGSKAAATGALTLMSSTLFFIAMAAVMTDLVLVACVSIALLAFWRRMQSEERITEWVFFIMIGLGLLAKGPLAAFLVGVPIALWALICGRLGDVWRRIAWIRGSLIVALVALPWYLLAERQYPGFLSYFLIGENVQRFLVSDWKGDLYGPVHELPHGMVWLFLWIAALPWSLIGAAVFVRARRSIRRNWRRRRELVIFALTAAGVPMVLFTAAQNVIFPYALPALVPCVIAALVLLGEETMTPRFVTGTALAAGATALAITIGATSLNGRIEDESERELVTAVESELNAPLDALYYWRHRYYSADYYSQGQASLLHEPAEIDLMLAQRMPFLLVMQDEQFDALPDSLRSSLRRIGDYSKKAIYEPAPDVVPETYSAVRR
jgi:4-amino-4-deoxy-L-arabinose transferase-like glycosyltransferase